ncbi:54S ribosomal protein L51, mitochondrial [Elsinoe australis]|uniref:Large ribosomal subunit protein mL43 n=1 Tax=Elsinoe australis TaxID=40998 RepID=A0A2P7Z7Q2_9PEZI|nr:54S ribosomal protein L51, mitochondrial [Elsinoe australis]
MPLQAVRSVAQSQNGVGAFILQCKQLNFHYCNFGGSSKGMKSFLTHTLPQFAKANPGIEINISPRPNKHPVIIGRYMNGREKAVCVRNLEKDQVLQKANLLRSASGEKLKRVTKPVRSLNESVRGIWDPFHAPAQKI